MSEQFNIELATADQFAAIGQLLVEVYSKLEGFPNIDEQPEYYELLAKVGDFTQHPGVDILVATNRQDLLGAVVYFSDLQHYGVEQAASIKNASGFRLLGVGPTARGLGVGRALAEACIGKARQNGHAQVVIHTTEYMKPAQAMYEKMGFERFPELDFIQKGLSVFGYRLEI